MELIQEILLSNILLNGLDSLAEPDTINKLISSIIRSHNEEKSEKKVALDMPRVHLLKHWCQMNGSIYKSAQVPSLKEMFDDNELLHFFIGYLNSIHSIAILQLYLTISMCVCVQNNTLLSV